MLAVHSIPVHSMQWIRDLVANNPDQNKGASLINGVQTRMRQAALQWLDIEKDMSAKGGEPATISGITIRGTNLV